MAFGNRWCRMLTCTRSRGGCGAIVSYIPTEAALEARRKKKDKDTGGLLINQAARLAEGSGESTSQRCARCEATMVKFDPQPGVVQARWRCSQWPTCRVLCPLVAVFPDASGEADGDI